MTDTKHNGWTNYATWRVNLEIFDGMHFVREDVATSDVAITVSDVADFLRNVAEQAITEQDTREGLAVDYALAFLSDVNYHEIANHLIEDNQWILEATI